MADPANHHRTGDPQAEHGQFVNGMRLVIEPSPPGGGEGTYPLAPPRLQASPAAVDHPATAPTDVDHAAVRALRKKVSDRMAQRLRDQANVTVEYRRAVGEDIAATLVREHVDTLREAGTPISRRQEQALLDAVAADLFGFGPLQQLLDDPGVVNVHVLGCDQVRIERVDGSVSHGAPLADSDEALVQMVQNVAMRATATERAMSVTRPWVDLQLPDGSRLTAMFQVSHRPVVTIRRHTLLDVTLEELRDRYGVLDDLLCEFLTAAMRAGLNIMVAGIAYTGKTTLVRALARLVPAGEPFVTLEESRELGLHARSDHPWAFSLEAREGHGQRGLDGRPAGEVTIADLIPLTLRMSVQRIIVGEVRSREVVPMLQAMTTSRGSLCTIHARHPRAVLDRIIELALSYGREMTADLARRMAAGALDLIVYLNAEDERAIGGRLHRYLSEVVEIGGMSGDRVVTTTIFGPGPDGRAVPKHLPERLLDPLVRAGYDPRALTPYIAAGEANRGAWRQPLDTLLRRRGSS